MGRGARTTADLATAPRRAVAAPYHNPHAEECLLSVDHQVIDPSTGAPYSSQRTGVAELDRLIGAFVAHGEVIVGACMGDQGGEREPVLRYARGWQAAGMCGDSGLAFEAFLAQRAPGRFAVRAGGGGLDECGYCDGQMSWGHNGVAYTSHYFSIVQADGHEYAIDFTATQYGYAQLPLVQRRGPGGSWLRRQADGSWAPAQQRSEAEGQQMAHELMQTDDWQSDLYACELVERYVPDWESLARGPSTIAR